MDGITDSQVSALQGVFDLPDTDRYYHWCLVYSVVIEQYSKNDRMEEATAKVQYLRQVVTAVHLPEVFFLLAFSYLLNDEKKGKFKEKKSGLWAQLNNRAQTNSKAVKRAVNQVLDIVELAEKGDIKGRSQLCLPNVAGWFRKHRFKELLQDLLEVTENDRAESQSIFEGIYSIFDKYNPAQKPEVLSGYISSAIERVARLMGQRKGSNNRDWKTANRLVGDWRIEADMSAVKEAAFRKKKKDNMAPS